MPNTREPVRCSWCNRLVAPGAGRIRMHESESSKFAGITVATFHPDCGEALLDWLMARLPEPELEMESRRCASDRRRGQVYGFSSAPPPPFGEAIAR